MHNGDGEDMQDWVEGLCQEQGEKEWMGEKGMASVMRGSQKGWERELRE